MSRDMFARMSNPVDRSTPLAKRIEEAFIQCLKQNVHPGPTAINERLGRGKKNKMNGRDSSLRVQLMWDFGVCYIRGDRIGRRPTQWYIDKTKEFGWRRNEL
jgi:hypothetical protein